MVLGGLGGSRGVLEGSGGVLGVPWVSAIPL